MAQRRAWARSSKRPGTGYSVLELVVALLISVTAMLIASQLLFEAQRRSTHAARQVLDPAIVLIVKQLRYDVQAAATATGSGGTLVLGGHPAGQVRYKLSAGDLVREVAAGAGLSPKGSRVVLRDARGFSWQTLASSGRPLVRITLCYEATAPLTALVVDGERQVAPTEVRTQSLIVALRGSGGSGW